MHGYNTEGDGSSEDGGGGEADESDSSSNCSICLATMEDGVLVKLIGNTERDTDYLCGHEFHGKCTDKWLQQSPTCPICTELILSDSSTSRSVVAVHDSGGACPAPLP